MKIQIWFVLLFAVGCKAASDLHTAQDISDSSLELFSLGDESVYSDEFIYVYKKNNTNNDSAFTRSDIKDYLDLYVKFKLKIAEAKSRGMDTTIAFNREFDSYKEQLKKPYLTENKVTERLVNEAYDRFKEEINASHILLQVNPEASPADTLKAYNKLLEIRNEALSGADFGELAKMHSNDPSAQFNGGNLGYFTSFQMVYPFESAAYRTNVGSVSMPVRTKFGYHLIKILDKRTSQGSVEVSHIMLRMNPSKADSLEARNKIFEIYDQATGGVSWNDLAKQFSDDINTKNTGGKLKAFKVGQMPIAFQEAAFALQSSGDISDPVLTPYGWHIIRLEQRIPLETFKEMEASIRSRIDRDSRADLNKKVLIDRLKKENGFNRTGEIENILTFSDSTLQSGNWEFDKENPVLKKALFTVADQIYTVNSFFKYILKQQRPNSYQPENYMRMLYNSYVEERIMAYEEEHLEEKYVDYRMLVKEYREGILLFELMENEVWNKAVEDTVGLKDFYDSHLNNYQWGKRKKAVIYNSDQEDVLSKIEVLIKSGDTLNLSKKALEKKFNGKTALTLQIEENLFEDGDNEVIDNVPWEIGVYRHATSGRNNLIWIQEIVAPQPKALNEVKGLVISNYQDFIEKHWVSELRSKYPVKMNEDGLKYIYEKLEK